MRLKHHSQTSCRGRPDAAGYGHMTTCHQRVGKCRRYRLWMLQNRRAISSKRSAREVRREQRGWCEKCSASPRKAPSLAPSWATSPEMSKEWVHRAGLATELTSRLGRRQGVLRQELQLRLHVRLVVGPVPGRLHKRRGPPDDARLRPAVQQLAGRGAGPAARRAHP